MKRIKELTVTTETGEQITYVGSGYLTETRTHIPGEKKSDDKPIFTVAAHLTPKT